MLILGALFTSLLACYTDLRSRKIYNSLTLSSFLAAWVIVIFFHPHQMLTSLYAFLGSLPLLLLYRLRILSGGDVKLLMALSVWLGVVLFLDFLLITFLFSGVIAFLQLLSQKKLPGFLGRFFLIFQKIPFSADETLKFPFSVPVFMALIFQFGVWQT